MNKDASDYDNLAGGEVESVVSRGNTVHVKLSNGWNLLITPEYGGRVHYHAPGKEPSSKFHLKVGFIDDSALTVRLISMGVIQAVEDGGLDGSYIYRRDFSETPTPDDKTLTPELFSGIIAGESSRGGSGSRQAGAHLADKVSSSRAHEVLLCNVPPTRAQVFGSSTTSIGSLSRKNPQPERPP